MDDIKPVFPTWQPYVPPAEPDPAPEAVFSDSETKTDIESNRIPNDEKPELSIVDEPIQSADIVANDSATEKVSYAGSRITEIEVSKIVPNPYQPRKTFDQSALQELADSIREHGVIQPIVVTATEHGYELVVGERRFRASQLAGMEKVPAIVKGDLGNQTKLEVALIENIQRQELNAIEEAQAYERLIKSFNLTQDQVAKKVGKSRPAVTNTLRLLNLPAEIQRAVIEGKISEGHARAILGIPDQDRQLAMYRTVIEQGLNVRQVEGRVRELTAKRHVDSIAPDPKLLALERELRGRLGTQVKIQRQGRGGKITIEFFSEEELEQLIQRMADDHDQADQEFFTV